MRLTDLVDSEKDMEIKGVTADSRSAGKGYLFAALPGHKTDGRKFISAAVSNGACAILAPSGTVLPENLPEDADVILVTDENPRRAFALAAAKFYRLQPENIAAVSGTSGKTSTVSFLQQLWALSGIKNCASLGTLGVRAPGFTRPGSLTTPDPVALYADLADLAAAGITHLAMEASSHGLDQYRLDGVRVTLAAFTNLSRDHLDYHADMEAYFSAKERLFTEILPPDATAVINADDAYGQRLLKSCVQKTIGFGKAGEDILLKSCVPDPRGQAVILDVQGREYNVTLPLVGEFQVMNALCALGLLMAGGAGAEDAVPLLENLKGVPGRLQLVAAHPKGAAVYVDYAHKPAALETILKTLRPHTKGRLICLFGCGGDRDRGKRPMMGKIASDLADLVVVTDDNPRSEDPALIRQEILEAAPGAREIAGRQEAIEWAVSQAQEGDVLVVAGKGHEQGQIFSDRREEFDDTQEVKNAMKRV